MAHAHVSIATLHALVHAAKSGAPASRKDLVAMAKREAGNLPGGLGNAVKAITLINDDPGLAQQIAGATRASDAAMLAELFAKAGLRGMDPGELEALAKAGSYFAEDHQAWPGLLGAIALGDRESVAQIGVKAGLSPRTIELLAKHGDLGGYALAKDLVSDAISW